MKVMSIDNCTVKLLEKGIEISRPNDENWPEKDLMIDWSQIQPFLKMTFI